MNLFGNAKEKAPEKTYPVTHTDEEWRKLLTPEQYQALRRHGTERPGNCALLRESRRRQLRLPRLRPAALQIAAQIRQRHRLAELQRPAARRDQTHLHPRSA